MGQQVKATLETLDHELLRKMAHKRRIALSAIIREAVREYVERRWRKA